MINLNIDLKNIEDVLREKLHRRTTLALLIAIAILGLLFLFSAIDFKALSWIEYSVMGVILICIFFIWHFSRRIPRVPKGTLGFAVAIYAESKHQREKITADFSQTLRELLSQGNQKYPIRLLEIPEHYARNIQDVESANSFIHTSRCFFMIYGRARVRLLDGKEYHVLNLEGIVRHRPIEEHISKNLSAEFAELFPRRLRVCCENDLLSFEFTSQWIKLVAMYVTGIAAFLSLDLDYAQSLFEEIGEVLERNKPNLPALIKIRQRIPDRLLEVFNTKNRAYYNAWRRSKKPHLLKDMKTYIDKAMEISPSDYRARISLSVFYFVAEKNVAAAVREIRKCKDEKVDPTWRFNYAFLLAYSGKMKEAIRMYKSAFANQNVSGSLLIELEEFICGVLGEEPEKVQLLFCLGLINFFGKKDRIRALQDFQRFIDVAVPRDYKEEIKLAQSYIGNIRGELRKEQT